VAEAKREGTVAAAPRTFNELIKSELGRPAGSPHPLSALREGDGSDAAADPAARARELAAKMIAEAFEGSVREMEEASRRRVEERRGEAAAVRELASAVAALGARDPRGEASAADARLRAAVRASPELVARVQGSADPDREMEAVVEEMRRVQQMIRRGGTGEAGAGGGARRGFFPKGPRG